MATQPRHRIPAQRRQEMLRAVRSGSMHPLAPSVSTARAIFAGYRERMPALAEAFAA